jgi:RNA polymerase sigma-70 factor, ECF subfamily
MDVQNALRFVEGCIDRYAEQAWRTAYVMLSNAADADDLLQQSFLVAWRKAEFAPRDNAWPWLAAIIAHEARNFRRKRKRRQGPSLDSISEPAMENDPNKNLERVELAALVHVSLAELDEDQRIAIVLTHLGGLSQTDAAAALGVPLNTLKARVRRGLDSLREALGRTTPNLENTLKTLPVAPPVGGLVCAKAAWTAGLSANVAVAGATTAGVAGGFKALFATAAAAVILTVGVVVAMTAPPDESPKPYVAQDIRDEPAKPTAEDRAPAKEVREPAGTHDPMPEPEPKPVALPARKTPALPEKSPPPEPVAGPETATVPPSEPEGLALAFAEYERLYPSAVASEWGTHARQVRTALTDKSPWIVIGAFEAVREAELDQPGSGKIFLPEILELFRSKEKLLKQEMVALNLIACLGTLIRKDERESMEVIHALVDWYGRTNDHSVRVRHAAEQVMFDLTGKDCTLDDEGLEYWSWWLRNKGLGQETDETPKKKARSVCVLFKESMVGTRVVFAIDVSASMRWPIDEADLPEMKKKLPDLDWDKLPVQVTPLDIAKSELARSIDKLRPEKGPDGKPVKRGTKLNPEARYFAIITYSTDVELFTNGWLEATDKNCNNWMTQVEKLEPEHTTNIHGGLISAFGLSAARTETPNSELDENCLLTGAHTIVFLTDGYPSWSDDSTAPSAKDEFGNPVGDGEYVKRDKLIELAAHLNRFRKVKINTVGIGNHDKELMSSLAKDSGGGYQDWYCRIESK